MSTPIYFYKVKSLINLKPNSLVALKDDNSSEFTLYVTTKEGLPTPLKGATKNLITGIVNTDGNLTISGNEEKIINLSPEIVNLINAAIQPGDNVSELVNDAGYLTSFTETDPIFQASEASNFVSGDKANLDNQSGVNTGDETTSSIQIKRPLKTVDNKSLEGVGNIEIDYTTVINKPASFPPSSHTHPISEVTNLQNELDNKESLSNKVNAIVGNSSTEYPTEKAVVDYVSSQIGADFAKVVYFNNTTPDTASIFDLNNPPLVNDPSLKEDVANLYIGTDASTWVYITSPAGYVTKTTTSSGSNFYVTGTNIDAGSIKTGSITKKGQIAIDSEALNDSGLTLKKVESSILKTDSSGKVVKTTNLQDVKYALETHATTHEFGGTDEIEGHNLKVDIIPNVQNYIPLTNTLKGHLKGIDNVLNSISDINSDIFSKEVITTLDLTTNNGFVNTESGIKGDILGTENCTIKFPAIDYTRKFRIDLVVRVLNATNVNARVEIKKSGNNWQGLSYFEVGAGNISMNKTHLNSQGVSEIPDNSTFQYSLIGNGKRVVRNIFPISAKWDGDYATTYLPPFTGQIISQTEVFNYNPSGTVEMFKGIDEISITGTNTNDIVISSVNVQYFDELEAYDHKSYLATLMDISVLNDAIDDVFPAFLYCPPNSKGLIQWHHPNGYNGTIEKSIYGNIFPELFNDGYAICYGTFNSYNVPAGTALWGAGVTSSNWGSPTGMVYRKALNDYCDALIKADHFIQMGGSMGAFNALSYAARFPSKIRAVVGFSGALDLTYNFNTNFTNTIRKAYGAAYRCIAESTGNNTSNNAFWIKIANETDAPQLEEYVNPFLDTYSPSKTYVPGDIVFEDYTGDVAGLAEFDLIANPRTLNKLPILLIHGDSDTLIDDQQSVDLQTSLNNVGGDVDLIIKQGANHLDISVFDYIAVDKFLNRMDINIEDVNSLQQELDNKASVNHFLTHEQGGTDEIQGQNLRVDVIPSVLHYSPVTNSLKGHLNGIDSKLGQLSTTTAGLLSRVFYTSDVVNVNGVNYLKTNFANGGTTASLIQTVSVNDNATQYFAQQLITDPFTTYVLGVRGSYTGQLTVMANPNSALQEFGIEAYRCDNLGIVLPSGVTGAPIGSLGVTVIAIMDSGQIQLDANQVTSLQITGELLSNVTFNAGERIRYRVFARKVGTTGGAINMSVYFGTNYNSYYDTPVQNTTDSVVNKSGIAGLTDTDALNWIKANKQDNLTIDQTLIDGSTNAVSGNAVFDADAKNVKLTGNQIVDGIKSLKQRLFFNRSLDNTPTANIGFTDEGYNFSVDSGGGGSFVSFKNSGAEVARFSPITGGLLINKTIGTVGYKFELEGKGAVSENFSAKNFTDLLAKRWVIFGDSFSNDFNNDYVGVVRDNLDLSAVTYAVSGASSASQLSELKGQVLVNSDFLKDFDIISLHIGVNDYANGSIALGNSSSIIGSGSISANIKEFIEVALTSNPLIKVFIITPMEANGGTSGLTYKANNASGWNLENLSTTISNICKYYSVQCVDLYSLAQINLKTIPILLSDGLHPNNTTGRKWIGDIVSRAFVSNNSSGMSPSTDNSSSGYILKKSLNNAFSNSNLFYNGTNLGLGKINPTREFDVNGVINSNSRYTINDGLKNNQFFGSGLFFSLSDSNNIGIRNDVGDILFAAGSAVENVIIKTNGNLLVNKTDDDFTNKLQVNGNITASPAISPNHVVVKSQLDTKLTTPTLTTNYLPKWNGTGFGNSLTQEIGTNVGFNVTPTDGQATQNFEMVNGSVISSRTFVPQLYISSNAVGQSFIPVRKVDGFATQYVIQGFDGSHNFLTASSGLAGSSIVWNTRMTITNNGNILFGKTTDAGDGLVQVNGNITASPAVAPNQVVVKSQLDAIIPTGLTTNYLPKWNGSGFGNSLVQEVGGELQVNGGVSFSGDLKILGGRYIGISSGAALYFDDGVQGMKIVHPGGFRIETANAVFTSPITASPAVAPNQVVVKSQLDAVAGTSGSYAVADLSPLKNMFVTYTIVGKILTLTITGTCDFPASGSGATSFNLPPGVTVSATGQAANKTVATAICDLTNNKTSLRINSSINSNGLSITYRGVSVQTAEPFAMTCQVLIN